MKKLNKYLNNLFFLKNAPKVFEKIYLDINTSKSYMQYCKDLHNVDFPCWNTLSINQRNFLESELSAIDIKNILDIGSGNGELTKYLCKKFECKGTGIDFAQSPTPEKLTSFIKSQFLKEQLITKYSAIISIDSFYMISNYKTYINKMISSLNDNGKVIILFTLTMQSFEGSKIEKALKSLKLNYNLTDFTQDDLNFWERSELLLEQNNQSFVDENKFNLWNIKKKEADKNVQLHKDNNIKRLALVIQRG